jgi:methylenetetrahydrofolate dehydrogenase (NAD+)
MPASCWPSPGRHDASKVAGRFNREISESVAASVAAGCGRPKLVGLLANDDPAAEVYGRMTRRACEKIGVDYELRRSDRLGLEDALIDANQDPDAHGILVYYPVFGGEKDAYLRDVVSIEKDVEGLSHQYRYSLYHNIRTLEGGKKCVLPCTPLACIKVLEELGAYDSTKSVGKQLSGKVAIVYNRSEVVGRPLAAMLANDGATVYSVDEHGILLYSVRLWQAAKLPHPRRHLLHPCPSPPPLPRFFFLLTILHTPPFRCARREWSTAPSRLRRRRRPRQRP